MRRCTSMMTLTNRAMMVGFCDAILHRGVGGLLIRGASGPVRYNPQKPEDSNQEQPSRRENFREADSSSQSFSWNQAAAKKKEGERWRQLTAWDEGGEEKRSVDMEEEGFASSEIRRLKAGMMNLDQKTAHSLPHQRQLGQKFAVAGAEEVLSSTSNAVSMNQKIVRKTRREVVERKPPMLQQKSEDFVKGSGLFYGDGRKFEGDMMNLDQEAVEICAPRVSCQRQSRKKYAVAGAEEAFSTSNVVFMNKEIVRNTRREIVEREFPMLQENSEDCVKGSGLFYGDGRKFEGLFLEKDYSLEDSLGGIEGASFKEIRDSVEEDDKDIAKEKSSAKNYSLRLLGMAPQTVQKLRQKLSDRGVSVGVIDSTISDLQRCGLQSDAEYAEAFARSRWRSAIWGPQRLKQELRRKGVGGDDIDNALHKVFSSNDDYAPLAQDVDDDEEEEVGGRRWGLTKEASDHLLDKARQQWGRGGNISDVARKRRMIGWLQRRGFNWLITSDILKVLEAKDKF